MVEVMVFQFAVQRDQRIVELGFGKRRQGAYKGVASVALYISLGIEFAWNSVRVFRLWLRWFRIHVDKIGLGPASARRCLNFGELKVPTGAVVNLRVPMAKPEAPILIT